MAVRRGWTLRFVGPNIKAMTTGKDISERVPGEIANFLEEMRGLTPGKTASRARLIFALDATASRKPTWDRACSVQGEMFLEADKKGGLDVQLAFFRGFGECKASKWVRHAGALVDLMTKVDCRAGRTQIERILRHAAKEAGKAPVQALVFIGDCSERTRGQAWRIGRTAWHAGCQNFSCSRKAMTLMPTWRLARSPD